MVIVVACVILLEAYKAHLEIVAQERFSCATMHPPTFRWWPERKYACFLSHYKAESGSDARYLSDLIRRMVGAEAFLDSSKPPAPEKKFFFF